MDSTRLHGAFPGDSIPMRQVDMMGVTRKSEPLSSIAITHLFFH